jgi:hypothetical protein
MVIVSPWLKIMFTTIIIIIIIIIIVACRVELECHSCNMGIDVHPVLMVAKLSF